MKKKIIAGFIMLLLMAVALPMSASASTSAYKTYISGYLEQSQAYELMLLINCYRDDYGLDPLVWDNEYEDYLTDRAAELSLFYSFTRPNGKEGTEWVHARNSSAYGFFEDVIYDDDYLDLFLDEDLETFCAGVFKPYGDEDDVFIACDFGYYLEGDSYQILDDDFYDLELYVKDGYLNLSSLFVNSNSKKWDSTNLKKGSTYRFVIGNLNKGTKADAIMFLDKFYAKSSNTNVVTITNTGKITAKRAGYATLTIKPNSLSGKSFKRTAIVRPQKVSGVKVTAPKKKTLKVTWNKIAGASGYQIYRSTSKNGKYKLVKTVTSGSTTSWTNGSLKGGKTYYYKVRGYVKYNDKKYAGSYSDKKYKKTKK